MKTTIENDPKVTSTADGPNVAPANASNGDGNKSQSRKAKNAALMQSKKEDEKIILYYAKENNITVGGKTKTTLCAENELNDTCPYGIFMK